MNSSSRCDEIRGVLLDHLDGMLDDADADVVTTHLETCAACARQAEATTAVRDVLYRPYDVGAPPADLPARIRRRRESPRRRWPLVLVRYAASFAAGVLVTLWLTSPPEPAPSAPPVIEDRPPVTQTLPPFPRRIR